MGRFCGQVRLGRLGSVVRLGCSGSAVRLGEFEFCREVRPVRSCSDI